MVAVAESLSTSLFSLWVLELGDTLIYSMIISLLVVVGAAVEAGLSRFDDVKKCDFSQTRI